MDSNEFQLRKEKINRNATIISLIFGLIVMLIYYIFI